jgi:hypothetical protein
MATIKEIGMNVQFRQILDKKFTMKNFIPFLLGRPSVAKL